MRVKKKKALALNWEASRAEKHHISLAVSKGCSAKGIERENPQRNSMQYITC